MGKQAKRKAEVVTATNPQTDNAKAADTKAETPTVVKKEEVAKDVALLAAAKETIGDKADAILDVFLSRKFRSARDEKGDASSKELFTLVGLEDNEGTRKAFDDVRSAAIIRLEKAASSKSIVAPKFKARYAANGGHCGDKLAIAFKEAKDANVSLEEIADKNGLDLHKEWPLKSAGGKYNPGQQRMNLGNRLRTMLRMGQPVTVGSTELSPQ